MNAFKRSRLSVVFMVFLLSSVIAGAAAPSWAQRTEPLIVDHTSTDITLLPEAAINLAKSSLHIAYGHTSHGSQLTDGMTGLVSFASGGGLDLSLPADIFAWNDGGTGGALDLEDYAMPLDLGYYPGWVNGTRDFLGDPDTQTGRGTNNPDVNVIIWAWCGQADNKYVAGTLGAEYLVPMTDLEDDYPGITFVYMTDHVDHDSDANNKAAQQVIRDFCTTNNKVLYDFADIECFDPDGTFFEYPHENCDYYDGAPGSLVGNWATEWQTSHTEGVDWYTCDSDHSEPLNANRKAYAAWWLWARLAGWSPPTGIDDTGTSPAPAAFELLQNCPNPFNPVTRISYRLPERTRVVLKVYDVEGKEIRTLVDGFKPQGAHDAWWDGRDAVGRRVSSGLYFYRLLTDRFVQTRKMTLLQ
jgi:hypothetical protein